MSKIRIGFEITRSWYLESFRNYIDKLRQIEEIELYIITNKPNSKFIEYLLKKLNIPESRFFRYYTFNEKVEAIESFDLNIFLDDNEEEFLNLCYLPLITYIISIDNKIDQKELTYSFIIECENLIKFVKEGQEQLVY